jgi:NADPH:quinone reductase-like Zn-dependent oxidoreductase
VLPQPLPLTPGSDIAGTVVEVGPEVKGFDIGDRVFGVTNPRFTNGYAEFALAHAGMIAKMPRELNFEQAASMPVIGVTAWQALHDFAQVRFGQRVLVLGGAGNVGAYAVQLARLAGAYVVATASQRDLDRVGHLGAQEAVERSQSTSAYEDSFDIVVDTVGGDALNQCFSLVKRGGVMVSIVEKPDAKRAAERSVRADFLLVSVNTSILEKLAALVVSDQLKTHVGDTLPLENASVVHQMMEERKQKPGKTLLVPKVGR